MKKKELFENDWKSRLTAVYSTNPDFQFPQGKETEQDTLPPSKQDLRVMLEKKNRGGKVVTVISGFIGSFEEMKVLEKFLKNKCGVGGSSKDGEILIQGSFVDKIMILLRESGYKVKKSGG